MSSTTLPSQPEQSLNLSSKARAFYELMKPGILRLLVLTTVCTMVVASQGMPRLDLMLWTLLGTTLVCGSANAINMVWDQDIDQIMNRTAHRPLVTGRLNTKEALIFSASIGLLGVLILTYFANPLAALMGVCGHVFYVVIYTMWLKRSTPQNIVIGGAAGAFPPLIGWAAVTGELSAAAWLIFALIFLWTPPHFWALALYKDIEYGKAGVPMMPVVQGHHTTIFQMLVYTMLLLGCTTLLAVMSTMGLVYLISSIALGAGFAYFCIRLAFSKDTEKWAKKTFAYSILYLALIFGAMSVDAVYTTHFTEEGYLMSIEAEAKRLRAQETEKHIQELRQQNLSVNPK